MCSMHRWFVFACLWWKGLGANMDDVSGWAQKCYQCHSSRFAWHPMSPHMLAFKLICCITGSNLATLPLLLLLYYWPHFSKLHWRGLDLLLECILSSRSVNSHLHLNVLKDFISNGLFCIYQVWFHVGSTFCTLDAIE